MEENVKLSAEELAELAALVNAGDEAAANASYLLTDDIDLPVETEREHDGLVLVGQLCEYLCHDRVRSVTRELVVRAEHWKACYYVVVIVHYPNRIFLVAGRKYSDISSENSSPVKLI